MDSVVAMLEGLRVDALGVNCGLGPVQMKPIIKRLTEVSSLPIVVNPNAGLPRSENGTTVFDIDAEEFATSWERLPAWACTRSAAAAARHRRTSVK